MVFKYNYLKSVLQRQYVSYSVYLVNGSSLYVFIDLSFEIHLLQVVIVDSIDWDSSGTQSSYMMISAEGFWKT